MVEWIKNNKKLIGSLVAIVVIIGGSIFGMNVIKYNTERDYLSIGTRQKDVISFAEQNKASTEAINEIRAILDQAKPSELTDETAGTINGRELIFAIDHGTYANTTPQIVVELWVQEDGTAIYREGMAEAYYTLDKESVQKLEGLLK